MPESSFQLLLSRCNYFAGWIFYIETKDCFNINYTTIAWKELKFELFIQR